MNNIAGAPRVDAVKEMGAVDKLERLLDAPVPTIAIPRETEIRVLPDGGVRIGKFVSLWKRITNSAVMWVNAIAGILATAWLSIPQETFTSLIPTKYAAWGMILYAIINALARARTI